MNVASLFVTLGLKGADKVGSSLGNVRKGLKNVTSTSLETKAAILGVMYGLERLTAQSGQMGTALTQFNNLTGLSADQLQRWQYLALKSGESADEMKNSIVGVQQAMSKMVLGQGFPAGLTAVKNITGFDVNRARETYYVLGKLREYAQKTKGTPDIANEVLGSFGLSPNSIQALRTSKVDLNKVPRSQMYSGGETEQLNKVNIAWAELGSKIEHSFGRLNAKFGPALVSDISKLADQVLRLVSSFAELAEKIELVRGIGTIFEGWGQIFTIMSEAVDKVNGKEKGKKAGFLPNMHQIDDWITEHAGGPSRSDALHSIRGGAGSTTNNINTNVTVHGDADGDALAGKIGNHVKKHIDTQNNRTARQLPSGGGY